jgi:hypothetical protein
MTAPIIRTVREKRYISHASQKVNKQKNSPLGALFQPSERQCTPLAPQQPERNAVAITD